MSLLISRIAKLSLRQNAGVRLFSSSSSRAPYLTLVAHVVGDSSGGDKVANVKLFDAVKEETVTIRNKIFPKELLPEARVIGSSRGWVAFLDDRDGTVRLSDIFNPWASESSPRVITLPPIVALPCSQTRVVKKVAMSSSPDQEDCVVAVKFWGDQLSLCRPGRDSEWTNIRTPSTYFDTSEVIYSKRDGMFQMPTDGSHYTAAFDLNNNTPKFRSLRFCNLPEMPQSELQLLNSWFRSEHLVEAPSSEFFVVKWFGRSFQEGTDREVERIYQTTGRFMVFRQEENNATVSYTRDIGDLCIFLGMNEAFCVAASMCPGLKANSIYFMGKGLGVYDIATDTVRNLDPSGVPTRVLRAPLWLPPLDH